MQMSLSVCGGKKHCLREFRPLKVQRKKGYLGLSPHCNPSKLTSHAQQSSGVSLHTEISKKGKSGISAERKTVGASNVKGN